jgi:hypothetical protein
LAPTGKCNQSKGNKEWRQWMISDAALSPKTKRVTDLEQRLQRLEVYETWRDIHPIDFAAMVGEETWEIYWQHWRDVLDEMEDSQTIAEDVKRLIAEKRQHGFAD